MKLLSRKARVESRRLPGSLDRAAVLLQAAIDDYAAEYGQHNPAEVPAEDARRVFADLAVVTSHIAALRAGSGVRS